MPLFGGVGQAGEDIDSQPHRFDRVDLFAHADELAEVAPFDEFHDQVRAEADRSRRSARCSDAAADADLAFAEELIAHRLVFAKPLAKRLDGDDGGLRVDRPIDAGERAGADEIQHLVFAVEVAAAFPLEQPVELVIGSSSLRRSRLVRSSSVTSRVPSSAHSACISRESTRPASMIRCESCSGEIVWLMAANSGRRNKTDGPPVPVGAKGRRARCEPQSASPYAISVARSLQPAAPRLVRPLRVGVPRPVRPAWRSAGRRATSRPKGCLARLAKLVDSRAARAVGQPGREAGRLSSGFVAIGQGRRPGESHDGEGQGGARGAATDGFQEVWPSQAMAAAAASVRPPSARPIQRCVASMPAANSCQPTSSASLRKRAVCPIMSRAAKGTEMPATAAQATWGQRPAAKLSCRPAATQPAGSRAIFRMLAPRADKPPSPRTSACTARMTAIVQRRAPDQAPRPRARRQPGDAQSRQHRRVHRLSCEHQRPQANSQSQLLPTGRLAAEHQASGSQADGGSAHGDGGTFGRDRPVSQVHERAPYRRN